jgi:hypothetical protein
MLIYWALFAFFAAGALIASPERPARLRSHPLLILGALIIALLIGLRFKVGADWRTYDFMFSFAGRVGLGSALEFGDPGYQFLNWAVQNAGWQIWVVNLVCGAIFTWGLFRFCRIQPEPWLAALVAIPYMVIVVAMGYTRQAVALGILMGGLAAFLRGGSTGRFAFYTAGAALFHKTAVVAFPLVALSSARNRFLNLLVGIAATILLYDLFLGDAMDQFVKHYIKTGYSSQGAAIRVAINLVAANAFWLVGRRMQFDETEWKLWRNFSLASVGFLVLLFALPSSTAVDRMALYVMPLQIAVLSRLPLVTHARLPGRTAVVAYLALVQFVWLNFAQHARYWVPYRVFPIWG